MREFEPLIRVNAVLRELTFVIHLPLPWSKRPDVRQIEPKEEPQP
jgi:hypothetical protein